MAANTDRVANNVLVEAAIKAVSGNKETLKSAPLLIKKILKEEAWRMFTTYRGEDVDPPSFEEFVTREPLSGLGATMDIVVDLLKRDVEATRLLEKVRQTERFEAAPVLAKHGGDRKSESVQVAVSQKGNLKMGSNSATYRLGVLKRDRSDIAERYASGEFKNVAAAERAAGIRDPKTNPTLVQRALTLVAKMTAEERSQFDAELRKVE